MNTTINISLPTTMYADIKKALIKRRFTSVSELIREAVRNILYPPSLTVNGFTKEFEEKVLAASKSSRKDDRVWNGKGSFSDFVLKTHSKSK